MVGLYLIVGALALFVVGTGLRFVLRPGMRRPQIRYGVWLGLNICAVCLGLMAAAMAAIWQVFGNQLDQYPGRSEWAGVLRPVVGAIGWCALGHGCAALCGLLVAALTRPRDSRYFSDDQQ